MSADLHWIISNHGDFLKRFGFDRDKITAEYEEWKKNHPDYVTTNHLFLELLRQATLFNMKNANTEEEFASISVEIISKQLGVSSGLSNEHRNYLTGLLHLNKLMISRLTLPFKFDVQIKATDCCSYCNKKNNKIYSLEKVIQRKYLPYVKCKNESGCNCSYSIVPLVDESGNLVPKEQW